VQANANNHLNFCGIKVYGQQTDVAYAFPGEGVAIEVDSKGLPWFVNKFGDIFQQAAGGTWSKVSDEATHMALTATDELYKVAKATARIEKWSDSAWVRKGTGARSIALGHNESWTTQPDNAQKWTVQTDYSIQYGDAAGSTWTALAGTAKDIAVGSEESIFIISKVEQPYLGSTILKLDYQNLWATLLNTPTNPVKIEVDDLGSVWFNNLAGQIFSQSDQSGYYWIEQDADNFNADVIAVGVNSNYYSQVQPAAQARNAVWTLNAYGQIIQLTNPIEDIYLVNAVHKVTADDYEYGPSNPIKRAERFQADASVAPYTCSISGTDGTWQADMMKLIQ
jgi:hypothetical protein